MSSLRTSLALLVALGVALVLAGPAAAEEEGGLSDEGGASWRLEQPAPPARVPGEAPLTPVGLGKIGDVEFWAPNRGLLITAGNGNTISPGLWAYDGQGWHELSTQCGGTNGRIAWAGPDEFWTVSDGRPGQAANALGDLPPLEDDTLCHFVGGAIVGSYASLAFQANSYQPMQAAGCLNPSDCWFAGNPLPEGQLGAFHLHWNGGSLIAEPYAQEGHAVEDMRPFEGQLYESVRLLPGDLVTQESPEPPVLHTINPEGISPTFETVPALPLYGPQEFPDALDFLHLSTDEESLWGAAGPQREAPAGSKEAGQVTVVRLASGVWKQLLGPGTTPSGQSRFPEETVSSIAAEPEESSAWLGLQSVQEEAPSPTTAAHLARISSEGAISDERSLPSAQELHEGVPPRGSVARIVCPAAHDCWMASTQGWLFHLAPEDERQLPQDSDPAFSHLITFRPPDAGLPQVAPDAPPEDDSGLPGELPAVVPPLVDISTSPIEASVPVALLSDLHSHLIHGTTLKLSFHLAVKAQVRLLAKRRKSTVASTPMRTLAAGNRSLELHLNRRRWPTKLELKTRALAPLPKTSTRSPSVNSVSTGLFVLPHTLALSGSELLP